MNNEDQLRAQLLQQATTNLQQAMRPTDATPYSIEDVIAAADKLYAWIKNPPAPAA